MIKGGLRGVFYISIIALVIVFFYNLFLVFNSNSREIFFERITVLILIIIILSILIAVSYFRSYDRNKSNDRVMGLVGKKAYTVSGDYFGTVKDVLLSKNKIYGLKIFNDSKKKKVILLSNLINSFGEVILVDSKVLDKV